MQLSAGWGPLDFEKMNKARKEGLPSADYFAVYALEDEDVIAKVEVLNLPYTTLEKTETISAIAGVLTRRDKAGLGVARKLLEEVHVREKTKILPSMDEPNKPRARSLFQTRVQGHFHSANCTEKSGGREFWKEK